MGSQHHMHTSSSPPLVFSSAFREFLIILYTWTCSLLYRSSIVWNSDYCSEYTTTVFYLRVHLVTASWNSGKKNTKTKSKKLMVCKSAFKGTLLRQIKLSMVWGLNCFSAPFSLMNHMCLMFTNFKVDHNCLDHSIRKSKSEVGSLRYWLPLHIETLGLF